MEPTRIVLTPAEIARMDRDEWSNLILRAYRIEAAFVVRRADGTIKYDDPALAGTYHEEVIDDGHEL